MKIIGTNKPKLELFFTSQDGHAKLNDSIIKLNQKNCFHRGFMIKKIDARENQQQPIGSVQSGLLGGARSVYGRMLSGGRKFR
jgi:hypothetical protein